MGGHADLEQHAVVLHQREALPLLFPALKAGSSYNDNGLVFAKPDGSPFHPHDVSKWFKEAGKRFGRPDFTLHVTRHTHASILIMNKTEILTVSKRLGHKSIKTTYDLYGHLLPEKDEEAADDFDTAIKTGVV